MEVHRNMDDKAVKASVLPTKRNNGCWRLVCPQNRIQYVHLLARRTRAGRRRKQINAPRSNINSIIETKRVAGGV